jgi:hypothetical protein
MDFCHRLTMRFAFGLGYQHIDGHNIILHLLRKIQMTSDDMFNVMKPAMMVMPMVMAVLMVMTVFMVMVLMVMVFIVVVLMVVVLMVLVVVFMLMVMVFILMVVVLMVLVVMNIHAFFFLTVNSHRNVRSGNTAFHRCLFLHMNTRNAKSVKFFDKSFLIGD